MSAIEKEIGRLADYIETVRERDTDAERRMNLKTDRPSLWQTP